MPCLAAFQAEASQEHDGKPQHPLQRHRLRVDISGVMDGLQGSGMNAQEASCMDVYVP